MGAVYRATHLGTKRTSSTEISSPTERHRLCLGTASRLGRTNSLTATGIRAQQRNFPTFFKIALLGYAPFTLIALMYRFSDVFIDPQRSSRTLASLLYLKTRKAGGESLRDASDQFEALDIPRSKWQARMKSRWTNTHACQ